MVEYLCISPVPAIARSKVRVCIFSLAGIAGSNPAGGMDVCRECCVLRGRGLCFGLITCREESYHGWCVCDREASIMRRPWSVRNS